MPHRTAAVPAAALPAAAPRPAPSALNQLRVAVPDAGRWSGAGPREPWSRAQSRALATVLIAGFRGFLLDLFATHDRARIDRAVDLWLSMLYAE